jgi:catechol 2,3-dioxygenase-like lactoylglutathione lyase family enzyme
VIGGLHHVGITVSDLDRSLAFYRDLLGLHIEARVADVPAEDVTGIAGARLSIADLDLPDGRLLELMQYTSGGGERLVQRTSNPGACHVAISVDDIDEICDRLERAGVTLRSRPVTLTDSGPRWDGSRVVYTVDPDGVTVELVQLPSGWTSASAR